jgi:hypothetical protein
MIHKSIISHCAAAAALLVGMTTASFANTYEYDWTGKGPGFSGKIILDEQSSTGGSMADIVSLTINTPLGVLTCPSPLLVHLDSLFTWNANEITQMHIIWNNAGGAMGAQLGQNNTGHSVLNFFDSAGAEALWMGGTWQAAPKTTSTVPDNASTFYLALVSLAATGIAARRLRSLTA